MSIDDTETVVLLSGGLDSATCLAFYRQSSSARLTALFVDYGQPAVNEERSAAGAIAEYFAVPLTRLVIGGARHKSPGRIQARNAMLLWLALAECPMSSGLIAIGIHAGVSYEDCAPAFVRLMQSGFDFHTSGSVRISAPLLSWSKAQVWDTAACLGVPIALTYSCEAGGPAGCGRCRSCQDREVLLART